MVVISIGPYKAQAPQRIDSIGQRARFKVKAQRVGYIVQEHPRLCVFGRVGWTVQLHTEAWRKIEQQGDDDFLIPREWTRDYSGRFYIIAHAWYQESLGDEFVRGTSKELWGRLMRTPYTKIPPEGTQVLERFWMANWEKGREPTFEVIQ